MAKIVVVEDQQVLATVYRNKFLAEGYEVEVASDGEAGLALINSANPDLVVLDVMLPKLRGLEVLKRVRANPSFKDLPVIIFSNASLPGMVEQAWEAGATMVLSKSNHSPKQIVESVRTALKTASETQKKGSATSAAVPTASPIVSLTPQPANSPGHILLVEDHPDMRALLSALLDQAGHQVTSVESHAGALRKSQLQEFDLFLVNRVSPDGLGVALCSQIRALSSRQPIVIYSTAALPVERQAGLDTGACAYLSSPAELLNIGNLLSELIKEFKSTANQTDAPAVDSPRVAA
jgi:DNA-binding response OmpR family regulator